MDKLLTTKEAAEYLRFNPRYLTRLVREGKIPARKIGHEWRFRMDLLEKWAWTDRPSQN